MGDRVAAAGNLFKTISTIVGTVVLVGGIAISTVLWFVGVQTKAEAAQQYEALSKVDAELSKRNDEVVVEVQKVGRDVTTIKCLLTKSKRKERDACGLQP